MISVHQAQAQFNGVLSSGSQNLVFERTCPSYGSETRYRTEIYVSDTTRSGQTRLIRRWIQSGVSSIEINQQTGLIQRQIQSDIESNVAISPNGKQVVFFEGQIAYRMNTDGTQLTRLVALPDSNLTRRTTFVWSPDSQQIASVTTKQESKLYPIDADGSGSIDVTPSFSAILSPMWSSDGQQIAFVTAPELKSSSPKANDRVFNPYVIKRITHS